MRKETVIAVNCEVMKKKKKKKKKQKMKNLGLKKAGNKVEECQGEDRVYISPIGQCERQCFWNIRGSF